MISKNKDFPYLKALIFLLFFESSKLLLKYSPINISISSEVIYWEIKPLKKPSITKFKCDRELNWFKVLEVKSKQ